MNSIQKHSGYTLIELMVAITLFAVLASIAVGGFSRTLQAQRRIGALVAVNSNASLILEQIARDVRVTNIDPVILDDNGVPVSAGGSGEGLQLTFTQEDGVTTYTVSYKRVTDGVPGSRGRIVVETDDGSTITSRQLTADTVDIRKLTFYDRGGTPPVTVVMKVAPSSTDPAVSETFLNLETTVWPRR